MVAQSLQPYQSDLWAWIQVQDMLRGLLHSLNLSCSHDHALDHRLAYRKGWLDKIIINYRINYLRTSRDFLAGKAIRI